MKLEMDVDYDDEFLEDIIVTAFEGGSNYWIERIKGFQNEKPKGTPVSVWVFDHLRKGETITLCMENDERAFLTMDRLKYGVKRYFSGKQDHIHLPLDAGDYDAGMADSVIQYAVFNDVIYG